MALSASFRPRPLQCPRCRAPLPEFTVRPDEETCAACGISFAAVAFAPPAPVVRLPEATFAVDPADPFGAGPAAVAGSDATPCARHPHHAAVANCSRCGVFICELCRIPLEGQELCPDCFDRMSREGSFTAVETHFFDASGLAISLVILGFLTSCFGIVLGPTAIVLAVQGLRQKRAWREVGGRGGPIFAIVLGVFLTLFGLALIAMMFAGAAGVAALGGAKK
ncbi:MAG TPA: DUF4190 domain-containing protein [Thermoanaerobaculia bacterium]|nr:DUF4190 domain-containing protein [Thermoanaerobaculia bacterium]